MAEIVRMPKLSNTMTEGIVAEWHKNIGDQIEIGDLLAEIETDKVVFNRNQQTAQSKTRSLFKSENIY